MVDCPQNKGGMWDGKDAICGVPSAAVPSMKATSVQATGGNFAKLFDDAEQEIYYSQLCELRLYRAVPLSDIRRLERAGFSGGALSETAKGGWFPILLLRFQSDFNRGVWSQGLGRYQAVHGLQADALSGGFLQSQGEFQMCAAVGREIPHPLHLHHKERAASVALLLAADQLPQVLYTSLGRGVRKESYAVFLQSYAPLPPETIFRRRPPQENRIGSFPRRFPGDSWSIRETAGADIPPQPGWGLGCPC